MVVLVESPKFLCAPYYIVIAVAVPTIVIAFSCSERDQDDLDDDDGAAFQAAAAAANAACCYIYYDDTVNDDDCWSVPSTGAPR